MEEIFGWDRNSKMVGCYSHVRLEAKRAAMRVFDLKELQIKAPSNEEPQASHKSPHSRGMERKR
jgi:hypothetical protein